MVTLNVKSKSMEIETVKKIILEGLEEEKRKLEYALDLTRKKIKDFEKKFGISTDIFIEKFKAREIKEDEETFVWWGEKKLEDELRDKLEILISIEICQQ